MPCTRRLGETPRPIEIREIPQGRAKPPAEPQPFQKAAIPFGLYELPRRSGEAHLYSIAGGAISLAIFDDRVEVWSAGQFPAGITPVMLSREHDSVQRNPIIADVFHRAGLIERWGRGTNRVISMCRGAGIHPPEFAEAGPSSVVIFRVNVAGGRRVETKHPWLTVEKSSEKILRFLAEHDAASAKELAAVLDLSSRAVDKQIAILRSTGRLRRIGSDKGGHWEVIP